MHIQIVPIMGSLIKSLKQHFDFAKDDRNVTEGNSVKFRYDE